MMRHEIHHAFERVLAVSAEDIEYFLQSIGTISWADFLLNPRRLRGSDFLMRWSQGVWSEHLLTQAVNATGQYFAIPYGPSGTAPDNDVREFELYFERLERAGLGSMKRPDLLVFRTGDDDRVSSIIDSLNGVGELPFTPEGDPRIQQLLSLAIIAVECENSLWRAQMMPDYHTPFTPQRRLNGRPGLKKSAVLPTVIVKEEDRRPLTQWQDTHHIPIHIWHAFFDEAYGIALDTVERLISGGDIEPTKQVFQAPGGATSEKVIYKIYYRHAYPLAQTVAYPELVADSITDRNGHILPYVKFIGGRSELTAEALAVLR
ncbi:MAG TPA: AccI family restriction endonuclease, partial [Armatimonadota bacterium]|nr:AccI family restriction endonuclease [Armatimonadota bacterium]